PARDVKLTGRNFTTPNPLDPSRGKATTGAYVPFGTATTAGQVIQGALPCTGALMRVPANGGGGKPELVAWGLRNPFGLGFRVDRVDPKTGAIEAFAVNRGKKNGPASALGTGGLERPVAVRFDNTGAALYVVDFGILTMDGKSPKPRPNTGVLWRITRTEV